MFRLWTLAISGLLLVSLWATFSVQQDIPQCLCLKDALPQDELRTTVRMKLFPDGSGRFLMAEKVTSFKL